MSFSEFNFIKSLPRQKHALLTRGIGDDAAVFAPGSKPWAISTDTLVEDVHFRGSDPLDLVGWKTVAVNLSDMAAMGCEPVFFLFNLQRPAGMPEHALQSLMCGIYKALDTHSTVLVGGDTVVAKSGPLSLTGTILGQPHSAEAVCRSTARPGDVVCVTGNGLGGSFPDKHLAFEPRLEWSRRLCLAGLPTSMMDISDGLLQDLGHILDESHVGARLDLWKIPVSEHICGDADGLQRALSDGEDFELLFTVNPGRLAQLPAGVPCHAIGLITEEAGHLTGRRQAGLPVEPLARRGYAHDS